MKGSRPIPFSFFLSISVSHTHRKEGNKTKKKKKVKRNMKISLDHSKQFPEKEEPNDLKINLPLIPKQKRCTLKRRINSNKQLIGSTKPNGLVLSIILKILVVIWRQTCSEQPKSPKMEGSGFKISKELSLEHQSEHDRPPRCLCKHLIIGERFGYIQQIQTKWNQVF